MTTTTPMRDPQVTATLLAALFDRAGEQRLDVVRLTDEEVSVLDGPEANHVAPFPWLSGLTSTQQDVARDVAARNLMVRGLAEPALLDEQTGNLVIGVADDLHAVLAARRAATAILIAERRTGSEARTHVVYVEDGERAVEEVVTPGGLHTFSAGPLALALDAVATFVDPEGAAGTADGPGRTVDLADASDLRSAVPVDQTRYVSVLAAVVPAPGEPVQRRICVMALADSVDVSTAVPGRPAATIRQVSRPTLRRMIGELLTED